MVFTGQPSQGCNNCRKSKKRCDQQEPSCGRCIRLGWKCGGYRHVNDIMFRDQTNHVLRQTGGSVDPRVSSSVSPSVTRNPSPDTEIVAQKFFFDQFVTETHLSFMQNTAPDEFLLQHIMACGLAGLANREKNERGREMARRYYVKAIAATNTALQRPKTAREDRTLIAVTLLAVFEQITWEPSRSSWKQHIQGSAQVIKLRGRRQIRTETGLVMFRELRWPIIFEALCSEEEAPKYIPQWSKLLDHDEKHSPGDELVALASRMASIRRSLKEGSKTDEALYESAAKLESDLLSWSESTQTEGSLCSFRIHTGLDPRYAYKGATHEYRTPQALRYWTLWRCLRILLSRTQESIYRRSWPSLMDASTLSSRERYDVSRGQMVVDICVAAASVMGSDASLQPSLGSVASGLGLVMPLCFAGTCLLEQGAQSELSPGGSHMMAVSEKKQETSDQLAWIIDRLDCIAEKVGIGWAAAVSKTITREDGEYRAAKES